MTKGHVEYILRCVVENPVTYKNEEHFPQELDPKLFRFFATARRLSVATAVKLVLPSTLSLSLNFMGPTRTYSPTSERGSSRRCRRVRLVAS